MEQRFTFPREEHLKSRKAIEALFKTGRSFFVHPYKVFYRCSAVTGTDTSQPLQPAIESGPPAMPGVKVGFAVSARNFKKAVDRNRIKRLGREAYRLNKQALVDVVVTKALQVEIFFVFTGKTLPNFELVSQQLVSCMGRLSAKLKTEK